MASFDVGGGWGARSVRPVIIFNDANKFKEFIKGDWSVNAGAEAAAKDGDAGISAAITTGEIRVTPITLKK
jgi:hypothetical protein